MLADEHVARRRPLRLREAPRQLAGGLYGLVILPRILQRVGEEEESLVEPRRARVSLEELPVERDRLGAGSLGVRPVAIGSRVALIGFRLRADCERKSASTKRRREALENLGLLGVATAQQKELAQGALLLLVLLPDDLLRVWMEQPRIPSGLRKCLAIDRRLRNRGGESCDGEHRHHRSTPSAGRESGRLLSRPLSVQPSGPPARRRSERTPPGSAAAGNRCAAPMGTPIPRERRCPRSMKRCWTGRRDGIGSYGSCRGPHGLRRRRTRLRALLSELVAIAAELVAPVLPFEGPEHFVLVDGGRRSMLRRGRYRSVRSLGHLLLASRDLEVEPQALAEELAQLAALEREPRPDPIADRLEQIEPRLAQFRQRGPGECGALERRSAIDRVELLRDLGDLRESGLQLGSRDHPGHLVARGLRKGGERSRSGEGIDRRLRRGHPLERTGKPLVEGPVADLELAQRAPGFGVAAVLVQDERLQHVRFGIVAALEERSVQGQEVSQRLVVVAVAEMGPARLEERIEPLGRGARDLRVPGLSAGIVAPGIGEPGKLQDGALVARARLVPFDGDLHYRLECGLRRVDVARRERGEGFGFTRVAFRGIARGDGAREDPRKRELGGGQLLRRGNGLRGGCGFGRGDRRRFGGPSLHRRERASFLGWSDDQRPFQMGAGELDRRRRGETRGRRAEKEREPDSAIGCALRQLLSGGGAYFRRTFLQEIAEGDRTEIVQPGRVERAQHLGDLLARIGAGLLVQRGERAGSVVFRMLRRLAYARRGRSPLLLRISE